MPFQSEKQRRYLWATHPDIAKQWAHNYPESNKGLPMYAHDKNKDSKKEKAAGFDVTALISPYVFTRIGVVNSILTENTPETAKNAADKLVKVKMPHSDKPTYAGQEREEGEIKTENTEQPKSEGVERREPENAINSLLQKISVVLSQPMAQLLENRKAEQEARQPQYQPRNPGIRRYAMPTPGIPLPVGMQQQPAQAQAQAQPAQAQQQQGAGMNSPSAQPINSFGPLSSSGNINGNAAFGQKNSPDSLKTAAGWDDDEYDWDDKPTRVLGTGREPGWLSDMHTKPVDQWRNPSDEELSAYYSKGLDRQLKKPNAHLRAWYESWDPNPKRRWLGLRAGDPKYNDQDYVDIHHNATPEQRQQFVSRLIAAMNQKDYEGRAHELVGLGAPIGKYNEPELNMKTAMPQNLKTALDKWAYGADAAAKADKSTKTAAGPFPQVGPPQADGSPTKLDTSPVGRMMQYFTGKPGYRVDWNKMPAGQPYVPPARQPEPMQQGAKSMFNNFLNTARGGLFTKRSNAANLFGEKLALDVARGGLGSRALASTIGHAGSFPVMTILDPHSHVNPTAWQGASGSLFDSAVNPLDARAQKHVQLAKDMERANPEELKDTHVSLGGPNLLKEYSRLFKNPRTSVLSKTHGALTLPIQTLLTNLSRGSAFNPQTNSVYLYGDEPAVLSHELGHAIDFNSGGPIPQYEPGKSKLKTWLQRQGKGLKHDAYAFSRMLPFIGGFPALHQEERANTLSRQNLERTYADNPAKLNDILDQRQRILPAGIGSYVGGAIGGLAGPFGGPLVQTPLAVGGALGGKIYGMQQAAHHNKKYVPEPKPEEKKDEKKEDDAPATLKMPERKEEKKDDEKKDEHAKAALYRGLQNTPTETGPEQIQDALFRFNQLRALARPTDEMLKGRGLSRAGFQHEMRRIARTSQGKDRFELSKIAPNPKLRAAITGAAGLAGTGLAAYAGGGTDALAVGLPATALAAGGTYLHAQHQRENLKNTAKLLKNYGLLNPQTLRQAYPLLGDDYRIG